MVFEHVELEGDVSPFDSVLNPSLAVHPAALAVSPETEPANRINMISQSIHFSDVSSADFDESLFNFVPNPDFAVHPASPAVFAGSRPRKISQHSSAARFLRCLCSCWYFGRKRRVRVTLSRIVPTNSSRAHPCSYLRFTR